MSEENPEIEKKEEPPVNPIKKTVGEPLVKQGEPLVADIKIIVKQPKVKKPEGEKKPRTEAQIKQMEKMKEALTKKRQEATLNKKKAEEAEQKEREEAVKKAEADAKKITANVEVQKVRGRKPGTKNPVKPVPQLKQIVPEPVQERQMSHMEYIVMQLRNKGVHVPDNVTPYMLKMIMSRFR